MMDLNRSEFAEMFAEFLSENPYHTTLFGYSIDLTNTKAIPPMSEWVARVVFDFVEWEKNRRNAAERVSF